MPCFCLSIILKHLRYSWHKQPQCKMQPYPTAAEASLIGMVSYVVSECVLKIFYKFSERQKEWKAATKALGFFVSAVFIFWLRKAGFSYLFLVRTVSLCRLPENRKAIFFLCCLCSAFNYIGTGMQTRKLKKFI